MFNTIFENISFVQFFMVFTMVVVLWRYNREKTNHKLLLCILVVSVAYEITSTILIANRINHNLLFNSMTIMHHTLWLAILYNSTGKKRWFGILIVLYVIVVVLQAFVFLDPHKFYNYGFILGAVIYVMIFVYESLMNMLDENLSFFSTGMLLLAAPILLFISLSFLLAFKEIQLFDTIIAGKLTLYNCIIIFGNIICYTLITIYIFKDKKLDNAR